MTLYLSNHFVVIATAIVAVLAVTRATRLIVDDTYPPVLWAKGKFVNAVGEKWAELVECPWCTAPYLAALEVAWVGLLVRFPHWSANTWIWWLVNGWAALSWLAAYLTVRDIPPDQR